MTLTTYISLYVFRCSYVLCGYNIDVRVYLYDFCLICCFIFGSAIYIYGFKLRCILCPYTVIAVLVMILCIIWYRT